MMNELALKESVRAETSGFEMKPRTLDEAMNFCKIMAQSDLVPNCYRDKPGNIMVAIQMGAELGLSPMRALRCIAVINGRASMWGDDMLAMVQASPVCEYVHENESTEVKGICKVKRKNDPEEFASIFSLEDAKRAGLLGKAGPWQTSTKRMLKLRARGFALRDKFADVLAGLVSVEEALDLPRIEPDSPGLNVLEAAQPVTLKDKLKTQLEQTDDKPADGAGAGAREVTPKSDTQQASDASAQAEEAQASSADHPATPYIAKVKTAHDEKEARAAYEATPDPLKQDVYPHYTTKLKELGRRKK